VGLERGPLSLVSTIEERLERKSSGFGVESREYGLRDPPRLPRGTLYPQRLVLTSPTRGGRSVGIVLSRTQVTEFVLSCLVVVPLPPGKNPIAVQFNNNNNNNNNNLMTL
jgi:hypothetical protein